MFTKTQPRTTPICITYTEQVCDNSRRTPKLAFSEWMWTFIWQSTWLVSWSICSLPIWSILLGSECQLIIRFCLDTKWWYCPFIVIILFNGIFVKIQRPLKSKPTGNDKKPLNKFWSFICFQENWWQIQILFVGFLLFPVVFHFGGRGTFYDDMPLVGSILFCRV